MVVSLQGSLWQRVHSDQAWRWSSRCQSKCSPCPHHVALKGAGTSTAFSPVHSLAAPPKLPDKQLPERLWLLPLQAHRLAPQGVHQLRPRWQPH
jgi:hypothetical protein